MTVEEIKTKKKSGDLKSAGEMIGITESNAYVALNRIGSKHHENIVNVLTKIIEMRELLANQQKTM
ncbi:MAG: hypothetical protein JW857_10350 [Bacteroidales bacterium]|nr:hypothetical protein [Bacteroidales bacterium]